VADEIVIQRLVIPIDGDDSGVKATFADTQKQADSWAVAMGNIIAQGFMALVQGAVDIAKGAMSEVMDVLDESVGIASDFQSSMADLQIAAGNADLSMQDLHAAAMTVGGDTSLLGVSASGAAESMVNLYKAGLDTTQIFGDVQGYLGGTADLAGALRASIDLAAASELDMVQASELAATTIATFGGQAEATGQTVDQWIVGALDNFVKSADASVADVSDLTAALGAVGPTAASFGFTLEDTNNALAILSTRGIKGAEAGTALKSMLTNIMRPTDQVKDSLAALNVDLYNTDGTLRSLPQIIGSFEQAMMGANEVTTMVGGRTQEQQAQLERLQKIYNSTAQTISDYEMGIKGVNLTEDARAEKLANLQEQLANAGTAIADLESIQGTAVTTMQTLTEEQRNQAIQTLAGTFGMKAMQTLLSEGVEGWDDMAEATEDAMGTQEQAAIKADTLAGALEGLDGVKETLLIGIGEGLLPVLQDLALWAQGMAETYGPPVVEFFTTVGEKASALFAILTETDFAEIFADIAELDFGSTADFFSTLAEDMDMPWIETIAQFFRETVPEALEVLGELYATWLEYWPTIQAVALTAWTVIQSIVTAVTAVIVDQVWPNLKEIFELLTGTLNDLGYDWQDVWQAIKQAIGIVAAAIGAIILFIISVVVGLVNGVTILIGNLIEVFFNLAENVMQVFAGIVMFLTGFWELLQGLFTGNQEQMKAGMDGMIEGIELAVSSFIQTVIDFFVGMSVGVLEAVAGLITGIVGFFVELYTDLVGGEDSQVVKMIKDIISWFKDADWLQLGTDIVDGIGKGIVDAAGNLAKKAAEAAAAALKAAKEFLGIESPSKLAAKEIGEPFGEGVGVGIEQSADSVMQSIDNLFAEVVPRVNQEAVTQIKEGDTYNLEANYAHQDERTLIDQVRFLQLEQSVATT